MSIHNEIHQTRPLVRCSPFLSRNQDTAEPIHCPDSVTLKAYSIPVLEEPLLWSLPSTNNPYPLQTSNDSSPWSHTHCSNLVDCTSMWYTHHSRHNIQVVVPLWTIIDCSQSPLEQGSIHSEHLHPRWWVSNSRLPPSIQDTFRTNTSTLDWNYQCSDGGHTAIKEGVNSWYIDQSILVF